MPNYRGKKRQNTSSRFKGVRWSKRDRKWLTTIRVRGKQYHLGLFVEEEDAAIVYNVALQLIAGEKAMLNVIGNFYDKPELQPE